MVPGLLAGPIPHTSSPDPPGNSLTLIQALNCSQRRIKLGVVGPRAGLQGRKLAFHFLKIPENLLDPEKLPNSPIYFLNLSISYCTSDVLEDKSHITKSPHL